MKKYSPLIAFIFTISLFFTACEPEEEPTPTDDRDKFIASWKCTEISSISGPSAFNVHIQPSATDENQIIMENFYNQGFDKKPYAVVSGSSLTIPQQLLGASTLKGSGSMTGTTIKMNYTVDDGGAVDTLSADFTKN